MKLAGVWLLIATGCASREPPGRRVDVHEPRLLLEGGASAPSAEPVVTSAGGMPDGKHKIASVAVRTWIYASPAERAQKIGYLRAGAVIDRSADSAGNDGCPGGWYRVVPRGYVCLGKGASLELAHPVVAAALRGPDRAQVTPYPYVFSGSPPPHLYYKLPSRKDMETAEGDSVWEHVKLHGPRLASYPKDEVPSFLAEGRELPKPYGAEKSLHLPSSHSGKAKEQSAFGLVTSFEWEGRRFGLTTEMDLLPLDRTKPARPSEIVGAPMKKGGRPGFVLRYGLSRYQIDASGKPKEDGVLAHRSVVELTGKTQAGLAEIASGGWVATEGLLVPSLREDPAGRAQQGKKWIEVSIGKQTLVAYEGKKPVYAAIIASGRGGMTDPETTTATIRGTFLIHAKHVSGTMDGEQGSDAFDLRDVPYIQYFHKGYALHGAYWHDEFGRPRSHGCVNLAPRDAAWLFDWTEPRVPAEWHGAVSLSEGGTLVWVHG